MKKKFFQPILIGLVFVFTVSNSFAQPKVPKETGSKATQQEAQAALDFHNKVRADVGVPPLVWSTQLAAYAQEWADHLVDEGGRTIYHRPEKSKKGKDYGENIFWGYGGNYSPLDASKDWYSEIKKYVYRPKPDTLDGTGHYTQMVWRITKMVGIGIARYGNREVFIVANYDPPGNWVGQKPY
jgi:hypothetical protein